MVLVSLKKTQPFWLPAFSMPHIKSELSAWAESNPTMPQRLVASESLTHNLHTYFSGHMGNYCTGIHRLRAAWFQAANQAPKVWGGGRVWGLLGFLYLFFSIGSEVDLHTVLTSLFSKGTSYSKSWCTCMFTCIYVYEDVDKDNTCRYYLYSFQKAVCDPFPLNNKSFSRPDLLCWAPGSDSPCCVSVVKLPDIPFLLQKATPSLCISAKCIELTFNPPQWPDVSAALAALTAALESI